MVGSAHRPHGTIGLRPSLGRSADIRGQNPLDLPQPMDCPRGDLSDDDRIAVIMAAPGFHEYSEFFDRQSGDRQSGAPLVSPGGFIVVDNISRGGPLHAARDSCANAPAGANAKIPWRRRCSQSHSTSSASTIRGADLGPLRAST
jgi:hypothetical protein